MLLIVFAPCGKPVGIFTGRFLRLINTEKHLDRSFSSVPRHPLSETNQSFCEQDKHAKNLAEKLAARLGRCVNKRQWDDTAYALSLLQHKNEDIAKKVQEGYRVVETEA